MFTQIYLLLECYKIDSGRVVRFIVRRALFIYQTYFIENIVSFHLIY